MGRFADTLIDVRWLLLSACACLMLIALVAQPTLVAAEPKVTEINLEQGDVLDAPPESVHMCFSEPVQLSADPNAEPTPAPGEEPPWRFNMTTPDGLGLGLRIVFEPSAECVEVIPGLPPDPPEGTWTFEWMVKAQEDGEEASDLITFAVGHESPSDSGSGSGSDSNGLSTLEIALIVVAGVCVAGAGAGFAMQRVRRKRNES